MIVVKVRSEKNKRYFEEEKKIKRERYVNRRRSYFIKNYVKAKENCWKRKEG